MLLLNPTKFQYVRGRWLSSPSSSSSTLSLFDILRCTTTSSYQSFHITKVHHAYDRSRQVPTFEQEEWEQENMLMAVVAVHLVVCFLSCSSSSANSTTSTSLLLLAERKTNVNIAFLSRSYYNNKTTGMWSVLIVFWRGLLVASRVVAATCRE